MNTALLSTASRRLACAAATILIGAPLVAVTPAHAADEVTLNLIGINDFHGRIDANTVKFAGTVEQVRQSGGDASSLLISAGDNVSASLFASAVQGDIPTIDVLNALHLDASAAGNHEFDKGAADLTGRLSDAADFPFLAANVFTADHTRLLDNYETFTIDGVDIAVVGAVTQETPSLVSPGGIEGLTFEDPTDSINDTVDELEALADPPDVIVASIHEGAPDGTKTLDENAAASPAFKKIVEQTDPAVDAIFMGHTHQAYAYDAPIPGEPGKTRPVLQTGNYGSNVGNIKLTFDKDTGTVTSYTKANIARTTTADADLVSTFPRVAAVKPIVDAALAFADTVGKEPIGKQTADITRAFNAGVEDRGGESTIGNLVGDSLLAKVKDTPAGADIGVTNPGGLRTDLLYAGTGGTNTDGVITYAEANSVLPFANTLNTVTLSGSSFIKVLEQQWQRNPDGTVPSRAYLQLGLSKNVHYTFDPTLPEGSRITSVTVNGEPMDPGASYKVAVPSFLATGGDNFRAFTEGTAVDTGLLDYEAWIDYLKANAPVSPDFARRAMRVEGLQGSYGVGDTVTFSLPKLDLTSLGSPKNASVSVTLLNGGNETDLGDFPVIEGAASPTVTLPAGVSGKAQLRVDATPSGTTALLPPFEINKPAATIEAATLPVIREGSWTVVVAKVTGDGEPKGLVTVSEGDKVLGKAQLWHGTTIVLTDARSLAPGEHQLTVTYGGDDVNGAATDQVTVTVVKRGHR